MNTEQMKKHIADGGIDRTLVHIYGEDAVALQKARYERAIEEFAKLYGADREITLYSVAGRSELSGNHTDHNHGCVIAASIDLDVIAVASPREDSVIRVKSEGFPEDRVDFAAYTQPAEKDFGTFSTIVRAGFDAQGEELPLLTQNFGKFPWGGDCIGQKAGVTTADKTVANLSLDNETVSVTAGTNASIGGITSTVRNGNAAFYRAIGMEGWTGYLNYMCPGYIQLGAASDNADGQPGNLISPVLNIPAGYDLLLTCKVAIWAAAPDQGMVGICEKNDGFWIPKGTLDKIVASTKSYVSLDIPAYTWVEVTAVIPNPGAKANLAFFISTADSWFSGSSVKAGRWYIDDIKLVY